MLLWVSLWCPSHSSFQSTDLSCFHHLSVSKHRKRHVTLHNNDRAQSQRPLSECKQPGRKQTGGFVQGDENCPPCYAHTLIQRVRCFWWTALIETSWFVPLHLHIIECFIMFYDALACEGRSPKVQSHAGSLLPRWCQFEVRFYYCESDL